MGGFGVMEGQDLITEEDEVMTQPKLWIIQSLNPTEMNENQQHTLLSNITELHSPYSHVSVGKNSLNTPDCLHGSLLGLEKAASRSRLVYL